MQKTVSHPDLIGNGSLRQVFSQQMKRAVNANTEYGIGISFTPENIPGGTPAVQPKAGTVTVTGSGSANTATIVLKVKNCNASGTAGSDISYTITVAAAKVAWSSGAASANSVKELIDLINEDDAGGTNGKFLRCFKAWALDAPYDMQINGAGQLASESEAYILPPGNTAAYSKFLTRDLDGMQYDSDFVMYKRIGFPESRDRGLFKLVDIFGSVTGTTGGTVKLYVDDVDDYVAPSGTYATDLANHELLFSCAAASISANSGTTPGSAPDVERASVCRGPCILEVKGDYNSITACDLRVLMQAVVG